MPDFEIHHASEPNLDEGKRRSRFSLLSRFSGGILIMTSLVCMGFGPFLLGKLNDLAADSRNAGTVDLESMPAVFAQLIQHRFAYLLLCVPALTCGVLLFVGARPKALWYGFGILCVLGMIGVLPASFIFWIAPLYQYQEL